MNVSCNKIAETLQKNYDKSVNQSEVNTFFINM